MLTGSSQKHSEVEVQGGEPAESILLRWPRRLSVLGRNPSRPLHWAQLAAALVRERAVDLAERPAMDNRESVRNRWQRHADGCAEAHKAAKRTLVLLCGAAVPCEPGVGVAEASWDEISQERAQSGDSAAGASAAAQTDCSPWENHKGVSGQ